MSAIITKDAKATAYALALATLTGDWPDIDNTQPDHVTITLTQNQIQWGQELFNDMLSKEPGDVRFANSSEIFLPVLKKKYWPWALGVLVLGAAVGMVAGRAIR